MRSSSWARASRSSSVAGAGLRGEPTRSASRRGRTPSSSALRALGVGAGDAVVTPALLVRRGGRGHRGDGGAARVLRRRARDDERERRDASSRRSPGRGARGSGCAPSCRCTSSGCARPWGSWRRWRGRGAGAGRGGRGAGASGRATTRGARRRRRAARPVLQLLPDEEPRRLGRRRRGRDVAGRAWRRAYPPPAGARRRRPVRPRRDRPQQPPRRAAGRRAPREVPHLPAWAGGARRLAARYLPRPARASRSSCRPSRPLPAVHAWHAFVVRSPRRDALCAFLRDAGSRRASTTRCRCTCSPASRRSASRRSR